MASFILYEKSRKVLSKIGNSIKARSTVLSVLSTLAERPPDGTLQLDVLDHSFLSASSFVSTDFIY